jgi:hypothetical protein
MESLLEARRDDFPRSIGQRGFVFTKFRHPLLSCSHASGHDSLCSSGGNRPMATDRRILELALKGLEAERARINTELAEILARLGRSAATSKKVTRKKRRRKMSTAQRQAISKKMKAAWARRKEAAA